MLQGTEHVYDVQPRGTVRETVISQRVADVTPRRVTQLVGSLLPNTPLGTELSVSRVQLAG